MSTGEPDPRTRLRRLLGARPDVGTVTAAGLLAVLGFVAAVTIGATEEDVLDRAGRDDLVRILDGLDGRVAALDEEVDRLRETRAKLLTSADAEAAAREEAARRAGDLGVLAGSVAADGPGVEVSIVGSEVDAGVLLRAVHELRDAGAEAVQLDGDGGGAPASVRVVAQTAFVDLPASGQVDVDGVPMGGPWRLLAIGDPATMETALRIPGGTVNEVEQAGGSIDVEQRLSLSVETLRPMSPPEYAQPVPESGRS